MIKNFTASFMTDKYEITMIQAALEAGTAHKKATFDLFARRLPQGRRYGVVGGVNRAINIIKNFVFTDEQLEYLKKDSTIHEQTIEFLKDYSFKGKIIGYREGEVFFPNSPILTVQGTFADAVILETVLLSVLNHDSAVMAAASRMVVAAKGMPLMEMGSRRTHEDAAVDSARVAYIAGFDSTSNIEAGMRYGIPIMGTSAHAFTLSFDTEKEAFEAQIKALGVGTTLLVDTYNIEQGIRNAIEVAGPELGGIRIDSGDLHEETVKARQLLDELGAKNTKIVLSSDIDEFTISEMIDRGTPVDSVGAGTRVVTGSGHPTAEMVFKLVERESENGKMIPVEKKSSGKKSIGGLKIAFRTYDENNKISQDFFIQDDNTSQMDRSWIPLQIVYADNCRFFTNTIEESRSYHKYALSTLDDEAKLISAGEAAFETIEKKENDNNGNRI